MKRKQQSHLQLPLEHTSIRDTATLTVTIWWPLLRATRCVFS